MTGATARWARRALTLSPLLIGLPVLVAITRSLVDVASLGHPFFADLGGTSNDAYSFHLGAPLFQSPDAGYTPQAYPPLLPLLSAGLDQVHLWSGWPVVVVVVSELGLVGLAAFLAYRPASSAAADRMVAAAGAIGFGALAWWLVGSVPFNFLYKPRPDELLWACALGGLALVPAVADGSRRALVASVLLLTAAAWTKQTGVMAWIAAVVALGAVVLARRAPARVALTFAAALGALNLALFAGFELGTHGWGGRFILDLPSRHPRVVGTWTSLGELWRAAVTGLALLGVLGLALLAGGSRPARAWPADRRIQIACVIGLFAVLDVVPAAYFRGPLGAAHNAYVGIAWSLGLLGAVAFGLAARRTRTLAVAALGIAALFTVTEMGSWARWLAEHRIVVAEKSRRVVAIEEPAGLREYARTRTVYHPVFPEVSTPTTGRLYPGHQNVEGLLAAGYQPGYLVRALLERRFDVVFLLADDPDRERLAGTGTWEDDYLWKLNEVVRAKYRPLRPVPSGLQVARQEPADLFTYVSPGVMERRPGPDPAPWMRDCFGPFRIAGLKWHIRHGGGFWCRPGGRGTELRLVRTRSLFTEVRANRERSLAGASLTVALPDRRGGFSVAGGSGGDRWTLDGRAAPGGRVLVRLSARGARAAATARPGSRGAGRLTLRFADTDSAPTLRAAADGMTVAVPRLSGGRLSLNATFDSRARFDLAGLRPR